MSQSRPARDPPAKRPPPFDPLPRTIGSVVGSDSFGKNEVVWQLLVRVGLIPEKPVCQHCHRDLPFETAKKHLHFSLMCSRYRVATNILGNTPLFEVRFIRKFLAALQGWCYEDKACSIMARTMIARDTWDRYKTIMENVVFNTLRRARQNNEMKLGGPGVIVEVDECHLHKRKYDRGQPLATGALWVVGLIERDATGQRKSVFLSTRRRSADVLVPFIRENVARGSILISDEWKGYTDELEDHYERLKINHSETYGYTIMYRGRRISVNTNHIEREWVEVRKITKNIPEDKYNAKLEKEIFRLMYFNRCRFVERPFIFLQKMAELLH